MRKGEGTSLGCGQTGPSPAPGPNGTKGLGTQFPSTSAVSRSAVEAELADGRLVAMEVADFPEWSVQLEVVHRVATTSTPDRPRAWT